MAFFKDGVKAHRWVKVVVFFFLGAALSFNNHLIEETLETSHKCSSPNAMLTALINLDLRQFIFTPYL